MSFQLTENTHRQLTQNVEKAIKDLLNRKEGNRELRVVSVHLPEDVMKDDTRAQKNAKIQGLSYTQAVYATLELKEGGKTIDKKKVKILDLPQVTKRGTYIVGGNEYSFPLQKRLIPGVYTRTHDDGTISAWLNSSKGRNMSITLRKKGDFILEVESIKINLYALLIGLGATDTQLRKVMGTEVFENNRNSRGAKNPKLALQKLYGKLKYPGDEPAASDSVADLRRWILKYFKTKSSYEPDNVGITLGKEFKETSVPLMLAVIQKILGVSRGEKEEDNKESLIHNDVFDLSDFVVERLNQRQYKFKFDRVLKRKLRDKKLRRVVDIYQKDLFQTPVESTFTQTNLSRIPKQNNPMDTASSFSEITVMGEGGIMSGHAVTRDVRAVDPSHLGFIDPAHTPEGQNIGTTLHLAKGVKKKGKSLVTQVYDVKTGKTAELTPREFYKAKVTFPEFYKNGKIKPGDDGLIKITHRGQISRVKPKEAQYAIRVATDMFGVNTMAVPFLSHNNGTRVMTAAKMQSQAKPLKYREEPLIQSAASEEQSNKTVEEVVGQNSLPRSPVNGTVKKVAKDLIVIEDSKGKAHEVGVSSDLWMNDNNYEDTEITVKVGDKVKKGQVLGESNYTRNGKLALGVNLRTAYLSYKGYNHEDGVVISESCAKKLTSLHAHQNTIPKQDNEVIGKKEFISYFPSVFTQDQLKKIGDDGVVKKGVTLQKGDPIVLKIRKVEEDTLSKKLQNISRLLTQDYRNTAETWTKSTVGKVAEIHNRRSDIMVVVKTEEKAKVSDKLVGRYGNKGTISMIIPDREMPKDEEGNAMDILLGPEGVPGRMNIGQILETTASRIAEKDGKPYIAKPFNGDETNKIQKELKKRRLKDHGSLFDGDKEIKGVLHGKQYMLKLEHQAEKKISARGAGAEYSYGLSGQPSRGDGQSGRAVGLGEMYALLSHGADANLEEMYTFKGDKQLEVWRAVENGTFIPPAKVPASSERFVGMLQGMGVDLVEDDNKIVKMVPFLDRDVKKVSAGEIKDATTLRAKDLKEEKGGLFDYSKTGGIIGEKFSHIRLAEPMPHPTFEKAITYVTHLKKSDIDDIMSGKKGVVNGEVVKGDAKGALTGGEAIRSLLKGIDAKGRLEQIKEEVKGKKGSPLNKLHREARILRNFKDNGIKLEEMVVDYVPVIPPKFRPIVELPTGDLSVADVNEHYRATIMMNNHLKEMKGRPGLKDEASKARRQLYESFKGVTGKSQGIVEKPDIKGLSKTIAGTNPKSGFFHSKLLKRRQDVSGTAVIAPDPKLNMDQIGIPEGMAYDIFKPFIIKELKSNGLTSMSARKEIEDKGQMARTALKKVMEERPVIANRAPTLHRYSMMAFQPKLVAGNGIKLPVEVLSGYNADMDGDSCIGRLYLAFRGSIENIDLAEFPRIESSKTTKGHIDEYDVPKGVEVYAYDQEKHQVRLYPVKKYSVHRDLSMRRVKYRSRRHVEVSDDHSLFCMNPDTLELFRSKPDESKGLFTPRPRQIELPPPKESIDWHCPSKAGKQLPDQMPLNETSGYFWGAMVGDGYASNKGRSSEYSYTLGFCNVEDDIIDAVQDFVTLCGGSMHSIHENPHTFDGHECFSKKAHWSFGNLGYNIQKFIGSGAANKKLPPFWIYGNEEFRLGLLAGLIDTDGSLQKVKKTHGGHQFHCTYYTKSEILAEDVQTLCASLGVKTSLTRDKRGYFVVNISPAYLKEYATRLPLKHPEKLEAAKQMASWDFKFDQKDVLPVPHELAVEVRSSIGSKNRSLYAIWSKSIKTGKITRETATKTPLEAYPDTELTAKFLALVAADNVFWDEVVEVEDMGDGFEAYDLTVPDSWVFMLSNHMIVYDTMGIHVPVKTEAVEEAKKMFMSNNLYYAGKQRQSLAPELGKEYMMGLFKLTRQGRTTSKSYKRTEEILRDAKTKKIRWTDVVSLRLEGRTTAGKVRVMEKVPRDMKDYQITLDAKNQQEFLKKLEKKHGKETVKKVMQDWKEAGRIFVYESGTSFLLSDLRMLTKERKQLYRQADQEAARVRRDTKLSQKEKDKKLIEIYSKVDSKIMGMTGTLRQNDAGKSNNIADMVQSGMSKPGKNQLKQLVGTVGLMMDHKQNVMPEPVRGNYAEGLDSSEYFAHMYAQRKGMIDKSQSVSGPGMLSKELTNSATTQKVTMADCGTTNGRYEKVDRDLIDRVIAENVVGIPKNTVIDEDGLSKLKKSGKTQVKVRSILTCEATSGICAKCFGIDEYGKFPPIGRNVGVSEIQTITERSVQLPMKAFHCSHRGSTVFIRDSEDCVYNMTHEELFYYVRERAVIGDDWEEKYLEEDLWVWDIQGWTKVEKIGRHKKNSPMTATKTTDGHIFVCQKNHPLMVRDACQVCSICKSSDLSVVGSGRNNDFIVACNVCSNKTYVNKKDWEMPYMQEVGDCKKGQIVHTSPGPNLCRGGYEHLYLNDYLLGMFLAEGSFSKESAPKMGRNLTNLTFCQKKGSEVFEKIAQEVESTGLPFGEHKKGFRINSKEVATHLINQTGHISSEKHLPMDYLTNATYKQMGDLLSGLIDGDGCIVRPKDQVNSFVQLDTTSFALVSQVKTICNYLGIKTNTTLSTIRKRTTKQGYCIKIYPSSEDCKKWFGASVKIKPEDYPEKRDRFEIPPYTEISQIKETFQEKDEWVYDLTTESGTFFASGIWNHNTGGVATADKGTANAFDRALQILRMPNNIRGKATLAEKSGMVESIRKSGYGGHIVTIGGKEHKIPQNLEVKVKRGQQVKKGDALSEGIVKPQELLKLRGVKAVQTQMTNDLHETFAGAGIKLHKRTYEVPVKMLTEQVRIVDPGGNDKFVAGDFTTMAKADGWNKANPGKRPIKYVNILPGSLYAPIHTDDWARRMALNRIGKTLEEGAAMGFSSNRVGNNPFADLALGPGTNLNTIKKK